MLELSNLEPTTRYWFAEVFEKLSNLRSLRDELESQERELIEHCKIKMLELNIKSLSDGATGCIFLRNYTRRHVDITKLQIALLEAGVPVDTIRKACEEATVVSNHGLICQFRRNSAKVEDDAT